MPRDTEVDNLFNGIKKNHFFNLVGFGGSGKTSLVHLLVQKYASEFYQIAYVVVNKSIKDDFIFQINDTIQILPPQKKRKKNFQQKKNLNRIDELSEEGEKKRKEEYLSIITYLENNYKSDKPNLLIIDINNALDGEATKFGEKLVTNTLPSNKIYPNGWKYLIVSRENIYAGIAKLNLDEKESENKEFLRRLFLKNAGEDKYKDFRDEGLSQLFQKMHYNPLLAEQLGIFLHDLEKYSLSEIYALLDNDSFKMNVRYGVTSQNRNSEEENTIIGFLRNLVVFEKLNKEEQLLLKHFILWPTDYIPQDVIQELLAKTFQSETNRLTKLWSIIKHYFDFSNGGVNRVGAFYNKTEKYNVSIAWNILSLILFVLLAAFSYGWIPISIPIKNVLDGMYGALLYYNIEILNHECTFRPVFNNLLRIIIGGAGGLLLGSFFPNSIFTYLGIIIFSPFVFSFPLFIKKLINYLLSNKYIQNTNKNTIENTLFRLTQKRFVSQNVTNNQKCYKLHGLIAESIRQQIDIQHTDYSDYMDSVRKISKKDDKDFVPFAHCIENSLSELNISHIEKLRMEIR